jgi:hypothetical protein
MAMRRLGIPTAGSRCHRRTSLPTAAAAVAPLLAACATASDGAEFELVAVDLAPGGLSSTGGFVFPGEDPATGGPTLRVVEGQQATITLITAPAGRVSHELADRLGLDRFAVVGMSMGGPHALAVPRCWPTGSPRSRYTPAPGRGPSQGSNHWPRHRSRRCATPSPKTPRRPSEATGRRSPNNDA